MDWMAPELFGTNEEISGLSTRESDIFALGMVNFEVRNVHGLKPCLMLCLRCSPGLELGRL